MEKAGAAQAVTVVLEDEIDLSRGDVLVHQDHRPALARTFDAHLIWMGEAPLLPGKRYEFKIGHRYVKGVVDSIQHRIDVNDLTTRETESLDLNGLARVRIALEEPVAIDDYKLSRATGSFIIVDLLHFGTVGAGMVIAPHTHAVRASSDVVWQPTKVTAKIRANQKNQKPAVVWFTGLSGAGKSTLANALEQALVQRGHHSYLLDGDNMRHGLNKDLDFSEAGRAENIRRIGEVSALFVDAGLLVITAFISPFRADRNSIRERIGDEKFIEIHVSTSLEECEKRDPKGLYVKARAGKISNFTGIDSPYEPPFNPQLTIDTSKVAIGVARRPDPALPREQGLPAPGGSRSMSSGVVIQGNFPIPEERRDQLQQLATELNREQLMWLSGYFAGAAAAAPSSIPAFQNNLLGGAQARAQHPAAAAPAAVAPIAPAAAALPTLTIISASHTGNGRKISEKLLAAVQALGMQARMIKAGDYQPREIAKEKLLYVVISTHGDGDPPDEARGLYEFLGTKRAPQLPELQYSVLALGDSSYPKFCEAGRVVDERLAKLGAKRLLPRVDCDVDFEKLATAWADDALARVREIAEKLKPASGAVTPMPSAAPAPVVAELHRAQSRHGGSARQPAHRRPPGAARSAPRGARVPGPRQALQAGRRARHRASQSGFGHRRRAESHQARWRRDRLARRQDAHAARVAARRARAHAHRAAVAGAGGQAGEGRHHRAARQCSGHGQTHGQLPGLRRAGQLSGGVDAGGAGGDAASGRRPRVFDRLEPRRGGRRGASHRGRRRQRHRSQVAGRRGLALRGEYAGGQQRAGLDRAQRALPRAGRRRARHHHGRPRHRRRAVPRLPAGARGHAAPPAATGCSSAAARCITISSTSSSGSRR